MPGVRLRLVQPDIPQAEKYLPRYVLRNWERLSLLSSGRPPPRPPSSSGRRRRRHSFWRARRWRSTRSRVLTARKHDADDRAPSAGERERDGEAHYYNSFYMFGRGGELLATYDKFHLVPFGEYLPFEQTLGQSGLTKLTGINGSFARGDGPHTYDVPGAPRVGPLICYEIIFPGEVVGAQAARLVRQCHGRFVVRALGRAAAASPGGARPRNRRGHARRARSQYGNLGDHRPARANHGKTGSRPAWRC